MSPMKEMHITGVKVAYYYICKTKLWLFSHEILMEKESPLVEIGKLIHDYSYKGFEKSIVVGDIAIDFVRKGDKLEIHEVKKSRSMEKAHKMQLLYYLYYLNKRGIEAVGIIDYPKLRKRVEVILDDEGIRDIESTLESIKEIISGEIPPPTRKKICNKCAYYEFCFGGEEDEK